MRPTRVAVAGSVDDGKSTLLGRLLHDARALPGDELEAVERASSGPLNLAFVTDGLQAERARGITLDVAYRHLVLGERRLLLADVPGHAELTRNLATGASTADAALLVVDVARGVQPQSRRHLLVLAALGVGEVVVVLNKLDAVGFEAAPALAVAEALGTLAAPLGLALEALPVSALHGDNVLHPSPRLAWHRGPTLAARLQRLAPRPPGPPRAVVQLAGDWAALHPLSGWRPAPGERLEAWPMGTPCAVLEAAEPARARLDTPLPRGALLAPAGAGPRVGRSLALTGVWLGPGEAAAGVPVTLLQPCRRTPGRLQGPFTRWSPATGRPEAAAGLAPGEVGTLGLGLEADTWHDAGAPWVLVDAGGRTVGGGRLGP